MKTSLASISYYFYLLCYVFEHSPLSLLHIGCGFEVVCDPHMLSKPDCLGLAELAVAAQKAVTTQKCTVATQKCMVAIPTLFKYYKVVKSSFLLLWNFVIV